MTAFLLGLVAILEAVAIVKLVRERGRLRRLLRIACDHPEPYTGADFLRSGSRIDGHV